MKKNILYLLLFVILAACSSDSGEDDVPPITSEDYNVKYRVTNNVSGETITLIAIENSVIKELESLEPGKTSGELSSTGSEYNAGINCTFLFRTSFKDGDEAITFFTTQKSGITVVLSKNNGGYYTEVKE